LATRIYAPNTKRQPPISPFDKMFAVAFATVFAASAVVSAVPLSIVKRAEPSGWATQYLEPYEEYHHRYLALHCQDKHNTSFFEQCCHPHLATETLEDFPSYCAPNSSSSSSAAAYVSTASITVSATDSADAGVASEYCEATSSIQSVYSSVVATASLSATSDWTTALAPSSTFTPSTSASVSPTSISTSINNDNNWAAPTSSSSSDPAATGSASSSGTSPVETGGFATFFYQNGVAGECGTVHSDNDKIIAIDKAWWTDYETNASSPYCGMTITITNTQNGKSVDALVADVCPTCNGPNSLDLSVAAFEAIASLPQGMVPITWQFT